MNFFFNYSFFIISVLFTSFFQETFTQSSIIMSSDVFYTPGNINVDGNANENVWFSVKENKIIYNVVNNKIELHEKTSDLDAIFKALWNSQGLMFYIDVTDDKLCFYDEEDNSKKCDRIDLQFLRNIENKGICDENVIHLWTYINKKNRGQLFGSLYGQDGIPDELKREIKFQYRLSGQGYGLEMFIPWQLFNITFNELNGEYHTMGFEIILSDFDGTSIESKLVWNPDNNIEGICFHPDFFGKLTLNNEVVVSENNLNKISRKEIYPNPVKNYLYTNIEIYKAEIYNITGSKILLFGNIYDGRMDVSKLIPGIYLLVITELNGSISTHKIIKK